MRKEFYGILPLALTSCLASQTTAQEKQTQRPNVVFIYADDIGYGDLSCNGAKTIHTPNVERLAKMGVRFTNAHSAAATSTPSRFGLFTIATIVTYLIQKFVLDAFGLEYLQTIAFILVIAALVQMVEIILKKVSPALYQALGVFLPLITTNCCILGVAILVIQKDFDLLTGVVYAFSTALGFALAMVLFAGIREQLSLVNIPKGMQGMAIALVNAGLLAMAFMGFSGVDKGLGVLFGIE